MSPFDDLIADKGQPPLDKLTPLPADQLARLATDLNGMVQRFRL